MRGEKSHEVVWLSLQGSQRGDERTGSPGDENSQGIRARKLQHGSDPVFPVMLWYQMSDRSETAETISVKLGTEALS